jgi:ethanolamine-phosphate cytidylyltransferase
MSSKGKDIVIFMDGAFDMMHYGHMNAFRQGRALGTKLVVGVNSDETITACKGALEIYYSTRTQLMNWF